MATFTLFRGFKEDTEVLTLINIATWKKYLERRAEFEHKYYENAIEWITAIQKEIKKLSPNTTNNGDHWVTALECDVAATKIRADASRNVAKYDRKAIAYLNNFTEDKVTVKSRKQLQQNLIKAKKSYAKIVSQLDARQKKITQAQIRLLDHLEALRIGAASNREREKLERKVLDATQAYQTGVEEEETERQRLVNLSVQYETKVKEAIKDKILCVVSTWKRIFENHTKNLYHKRDDGKWQLLKDTNILVKKFIRSIIEININGLHYNGLLAIKEMNIEQFVEELASSWKFVVTVPTASASRSINKEDTDESAIDFNVELSV